MRNTKSPESEIRLRLDQSVRKVRSTLDRCPAVDELAFVDDPESTAASVAEVSASLRAAEGCVDELAQLAELSEDAVALIAVSRISFTVVEEVLMTLLAAIDAQRDAA